MSIATDDAPLLFLGEGGSLPYDKEGKVSLTTNGGVGQSGVYYIPIPCSQAKAVSAFLRSYDTLEAAATLQETNMGIEVVGDADTSDDWVDRASPTVAAITGAGSQMIDIVATAVKRLRIELTVTVAGAVSAHGHGKD
jgi:hypothetical protein